MMSPPGKSRVLAAITALELLALASIAVAIADDRSDSVEFSEAELHSIDSLSPLPEIPDSPTNAFADAPGAAWLGQALFYNPQLSANGKISCANCHEPALGFSDARPLSEGLKTTTRHSPALWNVAYQRWFFWDGRADSLWSQSLQPLHSQAEMGGSPQLALQVITSDPSLAAVYRETFGLLPIKPIDQFYDRLVANLGKAFEAYQRKLISSNSAFDQWVAGDPAPDFGESAQRGLKLFIGRGQCVLCHAGPTLSDGEFHNIGLPGKPGTPFDLGRFSGIRQLKADRFNGLGALSDAPGPEANIKLRYLVQKVNNLGEFKTPTLRHVAETAPYMHDGRFSTLREVLDFYSELPGAPAYGHREETLVPLNLTEQEKQDLEAFLRSLTGAALDASLTTPPEPREVPTPSTEKGSF